MSYRSLELLPEETTRSIFAISFTNSLFTSGRIFWRVWEPMIRELVQTYAHPALDLRVRAFGGRRLLLAGAMAEACWRRRFDRVMYTLVNQAALLNHGPAFNSMGGRLTILPPTAGATYLALVPKPDADGHDQGGIRTVEIAVPVGTNLGWNLRAAGHRGTDLCGLSGGFIALANTKAERLAKGDPRLSLEERYRDHDGFVTAVERATRRLVRRRRLLLHLRGPCHIDRRRRALHD